MLRLAQRREPSASAQFQKQWKALLNAKHGTQVRALTSRFADQSSDQYIPPTGSPLQPVADLRGILVEHLGRFVANPREWKPANVTSNAKDEAISRILREFSKRIESYVARRLREEHLSQWRIAFKRSGKGSGRDRTQDVRSISEDVAPVEFSSHNGTHGRHLSRRARGIRSACQFEDLPLGNRPR